MHYGIIGIILIAAVYFIVTRRKQETYGGYTTATIIRRENPATIKPYEVKLVFQYEVDGQIYEGWTVRTKAAAPKEKIPVSYNEKHPEKYYVAM